MENAASASSSRSDSAGGKSVDAHAALHARKQVGSREERAGVVGALAEGMSLTQLKEYLTVHGFLHVTPRYNVEKVKFHIFYDFVVLEVPGNSSTGLVWKRKFGQDTASTS